MQNIHSSPASIERENKNKNKISLSPRIEVETRETLNSPPRFALLALKSLFSRQSYWSLLALTLATLLARLMTMPTFVEAFDSLYFVRGLQHYSVASLSPHWPGYPVYIWLGNLLNRAIPDPVLALHLLSVIASTLTLWPIAALAKD